MRCHVLWLKEYAAIFLKIFTVAVFSVIFSFARIASMMFQDFETDQLSH